MWGMNKIPNFIIIVLLLCIVMLQHTYHKEEMKELTKEIELDCNNDLWK